MHSEGYSSCFVCVCVSVCLCVCLHLFSNYRRWGDFWGIVTAWVIQVLEKIIGNFVENHFTREWETGMVVDSIMWPTQLINNAHVYS